MPAPRKYPEELKERATRLADAGTDRFPRTLGLVSKASGPTAESGGRGQVLEQGIALPA